MTMRHRRSFVRFRAIKSGFTIRKRLGKMVKVIRTDDKSEGSSYCVKLFKKYKKTKQN